MWACATHGMKALRNNLFRSQPGLAILFETNKISFRWEQIIEVFDKEEERH